MVDSNKVHYGFLMMLMENPNQKRTYRITSKVYEIAKRLNAELAKEKFTGNQKHNVGKKKCFDPNTGKEYFKTLDEIDGLILGRPEEYKKNRIGMNSGRIYYHNPLTNKVIHLKPDDKIPEGFIKGNPNAITNKFKGKKSFYHPITGKNVKTFICPEGYLEGTSNIWYTDGVKNLVINEILETPPLGWYKGKTFIRKKKHIT
jgi:hypothetical protein